MSLNRPWFILPWVILASSLLAAELPSPAVERYPGMCDASAAVPLDDQHFIVADDEVNTFRVYATETAGPEISAIPWDAFLISDRDLKHPEADIEGGTRLGDTLFWVTSHGRNLEGKWRTNRHQFFAVQIVKQEGQFTARPVGTSYNRLAIDLADSPALAGLGLAEALGPPHESEDELAPKDEGLNIEGLTVDKDGQGVLLGFRNPLPQGKALLIPLRNPQAVVAAGQTPEFGVPIQLQLHVRLRGEEYALGIRSIEYSPADQKYFIAAGPSNTRAVFAIYSWGGLPGERPQLLRSTTAVLEQKDFAPEALVLLGNRPQLLVLSDDGSMQVRVASPAECQEGTYQNGRCNQKHLNDPRRKTFGALRIDKR